MPHFLMLNSCFQLNIGPRAAPLSRGALHGGEDGQASRRDPRALPADMHALAIPSSVRAIGRAGAGTNNIPVAEMSKRGAPVFNAPGANANAVKELVLDQRVTW